MRPNKEIMRKKTYHLELWKDKQLGKCSIVLILLYSLLSSSLSLAADGLFFTYTTAQRLYIDMEICRQERSLCNESEGLLTEKVNGLSLDKETYRKEAEDYKAAYQKVDEARVKSETSRPSGLVWFMSGVLTTLATIVGLAVTN